MIRWAHLRIRVVSAKYMLIEAVVASAVFLVACSSSWVLADARVNHTINGRERT